MLYGKRISSATVTLLLLSIIFMLFFENVSADQCQECHGTDGDYTFEHFYVYSSTPRVVNPNEKFEHIINIEHPGNYQATEISVELILDHATELTCLEKTVKTLALNDGGSTKVKFEINAGEPSQSQRIQTVVSYTANYHYDPTEVVDIMDISVTIDRVLLAPTAWSFELEAGDRRTIDIEALENIQNIEVIPSSALEAIAEISHQIPSVVSKGEEFSIVLKAKNTGSGKLNIIYEDEDGGPHKLTLDIEVISSGSGEDDIWVLVGMIGGILSWILLFLSILIGTPLKKLKPVLNKVFKNAHIRKEVHCGICYVLVLLSVFHGVVVMVNHWKGVMLGYSLVLADLGMNYGLYITLGTVSWVLMIIISVTGIVVGPFSKKFKYNRWRFTHNVISLIALITAVVHGAVMLHFRFF